MIILEEERDVIINFISGVIETFKTQVGNFSSVGIYCCPWSGWITLSFNIDKSVSDTSYNCPDFQIVEFDMLEFEKWEVEYQNEMPTYMFEGKTINLDHELGVEVLNELFFKFLTAIIHDVKNEVNTDILLQMLDSNFFEIF